MLQTKTAEAMVHDLDFLMFLWVQACGTIVYILNRFSLYILKEKTPKEAFIGEKS